MLKKSSSPEISVVIPCLNEEENAAAICKAVIAEVEKTGCSFELIFIDNRSTDRTVPRQLRETVLHSVCARFSTVLGPGSDWYHEDHIHLDLAQRRNDYRICQWNVWDPLPQVAPLLPAERPEEAPPREVAAKPEAKEGAHDGGAETPPAPADKPAAGGNNGRSHQSATKKRR